MEDRFKFRVFGHQEKKMYHYSDFGRDFYYGAFIDNRFFGKGCYTTMQCTGLKDKNEKLIYEGDILKGLFADNLLIIENSGWEFNATSLNKKYGNYFLSCELKGFEIIGNIYENPELLEKN